MNHSPEINELATALAKAQAEFETAKKDGNNPHFRSTFATLASLKAAATPALSGNGLSVSQLVGFTDGHDVLTTMLLHSSGQFMAETMRLYLAKNDPQGQGSAITYAKRYSFQAVTGLATQDDETDDDGNAASKSSNSKSGNAKSGNAASLKQTVARKADPETGEVLSSGDGATDGQVKLAASLFRGKGLQDVADQTKYIEGVIGRAVPFAEVSKREASAVIDKLKTGAA